MAKGLKDYQSDHLHLFHGSSDGDINAHVPRQAMSYGMPDSDPAVHASEKLEPAIYMAVLGSKKLGGWGMRGRPGFGFYIVDSDLETAERENWFGYVYVLPKAGFIHKSGWEWVNHKEVKPVEKYRVGMDDLPADISVITRDEAKKYFNSERKRLG